MATGISWSILQGEEAENTNSVGARVGEDVGEVVGGPVGAVVGLAVGLYVGSTQTWQFRRARDAQTESN